MTILDRDRIIGEDFDLIIEYRTYTGLIELFGEEALHRIDEIYAVLHVPLSNFCRNFKCKVCRNSIIVWTYRCNQS